MTTIPGRRKRRGPRKPPSDMTKYMHSKGYKYSAPLQMWVPMRAIHGIDIRETS